MRARTRPRVPVPALALVGVLVGATSLTACKDDTAVRGGRSAGAATSAGASPGGGDQAQIDEAGGDVLAGDPALPPLDVAAFDPRWDAALSEPRQDPVYPEVGSDTLDALHYDLDLSWDPATRTLAGAETLLLRAPGPTASLVLDLSGALGVDQVRLDGEPVRFAHEDDDLVVTPAEPLEADERVVLQLTYAGTPRPVAAPTTRSDFATNGWTITDDGATWTMQEPYGALTWYAVDDQPSDKAFYDISLTVPQGWRGIANGQLVESRDDPAAPGADAGTHTDSWSLDAPAASYLVTAATGEYVTESDTGPGGLPITYWVPREKAKLMRGLRSLPADLAWLEERLGPYPFDSLGVLLVDSRSGMETQSMITLGMGDYTTSEAVLVHEASHQWYGDLVTPTTWDDLWMNEGMAMYLQLQWQAETGGFDVEESMDYLRSVEPGLRRTNGPPARTDPARFGTSGVYYGGALLWHTVRTRVGADGFDECSRAWLAEHALGNADRAQLVDFWASCTDTPPEVFRAWLEAPTSPANGLPDAPR